MSVEARTPLAQVLHERGGGGVRLRHQVTARVPLLLLEGLQDQRFFPRPHPFEPADPSVASRGLEIGERADAQPGVQQRDRLRTDTLEAEEFQQG